MLDRTDRRNLPSPGIKVVDLYSGAGGFSFAAKKCDGEIIFAVENDRHAANTYRLNFNATSEGATNVLYDQDILELNATELCAKHFDDVGECDLLLGGPPCQGFSSHRIKNAGVNDPRNKLIYSYFEFVSKLKPKLFLMENVPGMLWKRHKEYLDTFYELGRESGYHLFQPELVDARDFGLPQARRRVFILGVRADLPLKGFNWPPVPTHGSKTAIETHANLLPWNNCAPAFRKAPKGDANNIHMQHGEELTQVFKNTPKNGGSRQDSGRVLPCHKTHKGHKDVYGRIDPRKPAPTMTAGCSNPSKGRFVHPTQNHGITLRQAARIQTFPDTFVFTGGLTAAGKQIGNAVPVELGVVLINHLKTLLSREGLRKSFATEEMET